MVPHSLSNYESGTVTESTVQYCICRTGNRFRHFDSMPLQDVNIIDLVKIRTTPLLLQSDQMIDRKDSHPATLVLNHLQD